MIRARKLQYIGNQYLLNIPRSFVKRSNWDKGDYFDITYMDKNTLQIRKLADKTSTRAEALWPRETEEATSIFHTLLNDGWRLGPAEFPSLLGDLSHLLGKIRKHQIMILRPPPPMPRRATKK